MEHHKSLMFFQRYVYEAVFISKLTCQLSSFFVQNFRLYEQRPGCTNNVQVVRTTSRLYERRPGCTNDVQVVRTTSRLYERRPGCTNDLQVVRTTSTLYERRPRCTNDVHVVRTTSRLYERRPRCTNNVHVVRTTSTLYERQLCINYDHIREVIDFQMAKSADQSYRVRKTKMATGNQCVGVLKEHIARSIREVMSVLVDYLYYKIDRIEHILALSSQVVDIESSVAQCVRDAKELIANELDRVSNRSDQGYHTEQASSGNRGRPRYDIQEAQLQFFVRFGFSVSEMAKMLAVSQATVNRRLRDHGISFFFLLFFFY